MSDFRSFSGTPTIILPATQDFEPAVTTETLSKNTPYSARSNQCRQTDPGRENTRIPEFSKDIASNQERPPFPSAGQWTFLDNSSPALNAIQEVLLVSSRREHLRPPLSETTWSLSSVDNHRAKGSNKSPSPLSNRPTRLVADSRPTAGAQRLNANRFHRFRRAQQELVDSE